MSKGQYSIRTKESQSMHDKIVSSTVAYFESKGYNIKADHINWKNGAPDDIGGYTPDVVGTKTTINGLWATTETIVAEAETVDSYSNEHTKKQLKAFSATYKTYVNVPASVVTDMYTKLYEWSLTNVEVLQYG